MRSEDFGQRVVSALGVEGAREFLGIIDRPDADRAELLIDLEDEVGEMARLVMADALRRSLS